MYSVIYFRKCFKKAKTKTCLDDIFLKIIFYFDFIKNLQIQFI